MRSSQKPQGCGSLGLRRFCLSYEYAFTLRGPYGDFAFAEMPFCLTPDKISVFEAYRPTAVYKCIFIMMIRDANRNSRPLVVVMIDRIVRSNGESHSSQPGRAKQRGFAIKGNCTRLRGVLCELQPLNAIVNRMSSLTLSLCRSKVGGRVGVGVFCRIRKRAAFRCKCTIVHMNGVLYVCVD